MRMRDTAVSAETRRVDKDNDDIWQGEADGPLSFLEKLDFKTSIYPTPAMRRTLRQDIYLFLLFFLQTRHSI